MALTGFTLDRPRAFAIIISGATGQVYQFPDIEQMTTSKREDGSSGSWSLTAPLIKEYTKAKQGYPSVNEYSQVAAPMDLVALYMWRNVTTPTTPNPPIVLDPITQLGGGAPGAANNASALSALSYGDPGAVSVQALGQIATCVMVGMVDSARFVKGYSGSRSSFSMSGRDLTKIFETNWTTVPDLSYAGQTSGQPTATQPGFFGLTRIQISRALTGTIFIQAVLDLLVAKDLTVLPTLGSTPTSLSAKTIAAYAGFGYPWRNFVRTDALDPSYMPFTSQNIPTYSPQAGAVWSSLLEIRNPPISRMFVSEIGQLIYDDSYAAWTAANPIATIDQTLIRDFDSGFSDDELITFLSCMPSRTTGANADMFAVKGDYLAPSQTWVNGLAKAASGAAAQVSRFGYRYAQFTSLYDISPTDVANRIKYVLEVHNSIFTANLTVKGDAVYRAGSRVSVFEDSGRPETSNCTWYIDGVTHNFEFGDDWTTSLSLKYPVTAVSQTPI